MGNTNMSRKIVRSVIACTAGAVLSCLIFATGCSSNTPLAKAFVTISPGNQFDGTGSLFFVIAEASPTGVTWSLSGGSACSGAACGTLSGATSTSVTYTAPVTIPGSTMNVTITATSTTDSTVSASEVLTIFPVFVQITGPTNPVVVPLTSASLSATVVGDPTGQGVSWSLSGPCSSTPQGCGTFRSSTPTQTTFVAPAATSVETISITATSVADPNENASFQVTVPKLAVFVYTPTILPAATAGVPYSATVSIVGNTPPYTLTTTNAPTWATVTTGANTVTISGTPPAGTQGTAYTQINVVDSTAPVPLQSSQSFAVTTYPGVATGNNLLKGSYAFYATGWADGTSVGKTLNGIAYIGSFTADGNGNITGGELDVNSPTVGLTSYASLSGTYNVQYGSGVTGSQTGLITLIPSGKPPLPITLAVTLGGIQSGGTTATDLATRGNIVEYDDTSGIAANPTANSSGIRASGPLALQTASVLNTADNPLSGSFAFAMAGNGPVSVVTIACYGTAKNCGPISLAGAMTFGAGGTITAGEEDVMMQEVANPAVPFTGTMAEAGATDASGRIATTINATTTAGMLNWPSHFAIYAISPTAFYVMSLDPYTTNSLITGQALQQNLADIAAAPFTAGTPIVLYGNLTSTTSFGANGPNGQLRVELMVLTPTPTSATTGTLSGIQYVNASGTYTATTAPGTVGSYTYTVQPNGRAAVSSTGQPLMYFVDTNTGFGTQFATNAAPGIFTFLPQTSTTLNSGTYSFAGYNNTSQLAPQEVGTLVVPSGGVPNTGAIVSVSGYDYTAFGAAGNVYVVGEPILYNGPYTGTLSENAGTFVHAGTPTPAPPSGIIFSFAPGLSTGYFQGCGQAAPQGGGFVVSPTEFICVPAGGSFGVIHLFQQ